MNRYYFGIILFSLLSLLILGVFAQDNVLTLVTAQQNTNVRDSATTRGAVVGILNQGESAVVIDEDSNGENVSGITLWYQVRLTNGVEGWVWSGSVNRIQVTPTPSPTPRPTLIPNENVQSFTSENIRFLAPISQQPESGRGRPQRVAWSPDGDKILVGTLNGIWLHDVTTQQTERVADLSANTWSILKVGFIPNTTSIFYVVNQNGNVYVLIDNLASNSRPRRLEIIGESPQRFRDEYRNAFVSPDGQILALAGAQLRLIRLVTATPDSDIDDEVVGNIRPNYRLSTIAFHPNSQQLAVIGGDGGEFYLEGYRVDDQSQLYRHNIRTTNARFMFFHSDGAQLTVVGNFMKFFNFDLVTGRKSLEYDGTGFNIQDAQLSSDGLQLAVAVDGMGIILYNTKTASSITSLTDYDTPVSFDISSDGQNIAGVVSGFWGNYGGYLRLSDVATNTTRYSELFYANGAHFDNTGTHIYLRIAERFNLYATDNLDGEALRTTVLPPWATIAVPSVDNTRFYLAQSTSQNNVRIGQLQIWDAETSQAMSDMTTLNVAIRQLWAHPNNQSIMVLLEDGDISVRNAQNLSEITRLSHPYSDISILKFSGDGQKFATAGSAMTVAIWSQDNQLIRRVEVPESYREANFSGWSDIDINGDSSLVVASSPNRVFFWNGQTGSFLRQLPIGASKVTIHPDGNTVIIMTGISGTLFYDTQLGVLQDVAPFGSINDMSVNANGSLFLTNGDKLVTWGIPNLVAPQSRFTRVLFEDNFESGNTRRWDGIQTNWVIEEPDGNRVLSIDNTSANYIDFTPRNNPQANHMILEARLRIMRTANQSDNPKFDFMFLQPDIGVGIYNMRQTLWTSNVFSRSENQLYGFGIIDFQTPTDDWLNVKIEVYRDSNEGNVMMVYVDNRLVYQSTHLGGRWGAFNLSLPPTSFIQLDDVRIIEVVANQSSTPTPSPTATPSLTPTPSPTATPDTTVFFDNFEDGNLDGWDLRYANNAVEIAVVDGNRVLYITGTQDDFISLGFLDDLNGANVLEARMQFIDLGLNNSSMNFNLMSENPGHALGYSALISIGGAFFADRDGGFQMIEAITVHDTTFEFNRWYTVRFQLINSSLNLLIDGRSIHLARVEPRQTGSPVFIFDTGMKFYLDDVRIQKTQ